MIGSGTAVVSQESVVCGAVCDELEGLRCSACSGCFCLEEEVGCEAGAHDNDIITMKAAIVPKNKTERKKSFITGMRL